MNSGSSCSPAPSSKPSLSCPRSCGTNPKGPNPKPQTPKPMPSAVRIPELVPSRRKKALNKKQESPKPNP